MAICWCIPLQAIQSHARCVASECCCAARMCLACTWQVQNTPVTTRLACHPSSSHREKRQPRGALLVRQLESALYALAQKAEQDWHMHAEHIG